MRSLATKMLMQRTYLLIAAISVELFFANPAAAQEELAKAKNCLACHAAKSKLVGPSFQEIAAKYSQKKSAREILVKKIIKGGSGAWGPLPMPPNSHVNESEATRLVEWILAQN